MICKAKGTNKGSSSSSVMIFVQNYELKSNMQIISCHYYDILTFPIHANAKMLLPRFPAMAGQMVRV
jgi:hypothetical protein